MNFSVIRLWASTSKAVGKWPKGNFCLIFWIFILYRIFYFPGAFSFKLAGLVEGYRFSVLVSVGLTSRQPWVLSNREREGGKPKETQPLHPNRAHDWLFREKKMKEAWKRGALMEGSMREYLRIMELLPCQPLGAISNDGTSMVGWKCKTRSLISTWGQQKCLKKSLSPSTEFYLLVIWFIGQQQLHVLAGLSFLLTIFWWDPKQKLCRQFLRRGAWECLCQYCNFWVLFSWVGNVHRELIWLLAHFWFLTLSWNAGFPAWQAYHSVLDSSLNLSETHTVYLFIAFWSITLLMWRGCF